MNIFGKINIDYDQLDTSSRVNAKLSCLKMCNNDVAKAKELYDFIMGDLSTIPETTPSPLSVMDQAKGVATDTWSFLNNNQDKLVQCYALFKAMKSGASPGEILTALAGGSTAGATATVTDLPTI